MQGGWLEHASRSFRDARVLSAVTTLAIQNDVDVGGNRQLAGTYVDQNGVSLGTIGGGNLPEATAATEVRLSGQLATLLPAFTGLSSAGVQANTRAGLASVPFPATGETGTPRGAAGPFQAGAAFDLYDQSVALNSYGVSGYRPFLHLAHPSNAGSNYLAAADFGDLTTNLQFWSDGLHNSGQLGLGNAIAVASGSYGARIRADLLDNARRQGLVDASGAAYALLDLPLWDQYQVGGVNVITIIETRPVQRLCRRRSPRRASGDISFPIWSRTPIPGCQRAFAGVQSRASLCFCEAKP